jgi:hypothetical protein
MTELAPCGCKSECHHLNYPINAAFAPQRACRNITRERDALKEQFTEHLDKTRPATLAVVRAWRELHPMERHFAPGDLAKALDALTAAVKEGQS